MQSQNSLLHFQHTYFLHIVIYIYIYIYIYWQGLGVIISALELKVNK